MNKTFILKRGRGATWARSPSYLYSQVNSISWKRSNTSDIPFVGCASIGPTGMPVFIRSIKEERGENEGRGRVKGKMMEREGKKSTWCECAVRGKSIYTVFDQMFHEELVVWQSVKVIT